MKTAPRGTVIAAATPRAAARIKQSAARRVRHRARCALIARQKRRAKASRRRALRRRSDGGEQRMKMWRGGG